MNISAWMLPVLIGLLPLSTATADDLAHFMLGGREYQFDVVEMHNNQSLISIYYFQALDFNKSKFPEMEILIGQSYVSLGEMSFSMLAFRPSPQSSDVIIEAAFGIPPNAFTTTRQSSLATYLADAFHLLEAGSKAPELRDSTVHKISD